MCPEDVKKKNGPNLTLRLLTDWFVLDKRIDMACNRPVVP